MGGRLTLYDLLDVEADASREEIAVRIGELKRAWNPDRFEKGRDAALAKEARGRCAHLDLAESVLLNRVERSRYDSSLRGEDHFPGRGPSGPASFQREDWPLVQPERIEVDSRFGSGARGEFVQDRGLRPRGDSARWPDEVLPAMTLPAVTLPPMPQFPPPARRAPSVVDEWVSDVGDWVEDAVESPFRAVFSPLASSHTLRLMLLGVLSWMAILGCYAVTGAVQEGSVVWNIAHVGMCIAAIGVVRSFVVVGYLATIGVVVSGVGLLLWSYTPRAVEYVVTNFW